MVKIQIGAYYNVWYGSPIVPIIGGGDWKGSLPPETPLLGYYDSRDDDVIQRHVDWAKKANIDFFAVAWGNISSWDDISLKEHYLRHPAGSTFKFCIFYDSMQALNRHRFNNFLSYDFEERFSPQKTKGEKFLDDFEYLADNYFSRPNYLKIDGRPLVIIYNVAGFANSQDYLEKLAENMKKRGWELFLIADAVSWAGTKLSKKNFGFLWQTPPKEICRVIARALQRLSFQNLKEINLQRYFKGITGYNLFSPNHVNNFFQEIDGLYKKFSSYAVKNKLCFIPNIMPGFDDRLMSGLGNPVLDKKAGEFYKSFWQTAKKYLSPDLPLVLITSFNEWHEGTEIEPSKEYGEKYLEITRSFKDSIT